MVVSTQASIIADVQNDPQNLGVDWSVSCRIGSSSCGSFNPAHTASGSPTTYTAPASIPLGYTVTVTAAATADPTKRATATITITSGSSGITITFLQPPPLSLQAGAEATVSADVQNDLPNEGVDWSVSCGGSSCGSFNPNHTQNDATTTFTAPSSPPPGNTVTITATSHTDPNQSVSQVVTIAPGGPLGLLFGSYSFYFTGTDTNGFFAAAGSIVADGKGNITAGEEDEYDKVTAALPAAVSGTYTILPDGRGSITLMGGTFQQTLSFALVSSKHGLIMEFDGNATSSGSLDLQTPSAFNLSSISGNYAFTLAGMDVVNKKALDMGGVLTADGLGNFTVGTEDLNDGGAVTQDLALSGKYNQVPIDSFGRGTATLVYSTGSPPVMVTTNFVFYVVDAKTLRLMETDITSTTLGTGVTVGSALAQGAGPFTDASLPNGNYAFTVGVQNGLGKLAAGGLFTSNGQGLLTAGTVDVTNGSTVVTNTNVTGGYSIDPNGRGTLSFTPTTGGVSQFGVYVTASQGVLLLELDSGLTSRGTALAQSGNLILSGNFSSSFDAVTTKGEVDLVGKVFADGASNLIGLADINQFGLGAQTPGTALAGVYSASPNGRLITTLSSGPTGTLNETLYVVNGNTVLFIESDPLGLTAGPATGILQLQQITAPLYVGFDPLPPALYVLGQQTPLTAIVANDPGSKGVDWAVTCGSPGACGSFSPTHTPSGVPTTYTAPSSNPAGDTVTITATSTADPSQNATATLAAAIAITFTEPPPSSMPISTSTPVIATVNGDAMNLGVTWCVTCGSQDCGNFDSNHTASGAQTNYNAPAVIPSPNTVTITAAATADPTKTVTATVTITGPPIMITFTSNADGSVGPPASMQTNTQATMGAEVQNDPQDLGVDWSVSCGSPGACGSFNPTHTPSDVTTTYTAPASVPSGGTVTITATATADPTKSVSADTTITSAGPYAGDIKGPYAFLVTGKGDSTAGLSYSPYVLVGSINADGTGLITKGEEDFFNLDTNSPIQVKVLSGYYNVQQDGHGTMTLLTDQPQLFVGGNQTFSIVAVSKQHVLIGQFDTSATSSGTLDLQTPTKFKLSSVTGGYSFTFSGLDTSQFTFKDPITFPLNIGGVLTADGAGNFKNGIEDVNDGGTVTTGSAVSGTYSAIDKTFGRGTATLGASTFVFYIVDGTTLRFIESDLHGLTSGSLYTLGTGSYSNASLSGNYAFTVAGNSATGALAAGGLFTANGSGTITAATQDVNDAGTVSGPVTTTGSYSVNSNGRGTLTLTAGLGGVSEFGLYFTANQGVLMVELDGGAAWLTSRGTALAQSGTISAGTFKGPYAGSSDGSITNGEQDIIGQVVADGVKSLSGTVDINQYIVGVGGNPTQDDTLTGTFTASPSGRFTGTLDTPTVGTLNEIFYLVNIVNGTANTVLFLEVDPDGGTAGPATGILQFQKLK